MCQACLVVYDGYATQPRHPCLVVHDGYVRPLRSHGPPVDDLCGEIDRSLARMSCAHGIGHAFGDAERRVPGSFVGGIVALDANDTGGTIWSHSNDKTMKRWGVVTRELVLEDVAPPDPGTSCSAIGVSADGMRQCRWVSR